MTVEIRKGEIRLADGETVEIEVLDHGEDFNPDEKGSTPNHDRVIIIYPDKT